MEVSIAPNMDRPEARYAGYAQIAINGYAIDFLNQSY
jgi:hypothetical protein